MVGSMQIAEMPYRICLRHNDGMGTRGTVVCVRGRSCFFAPVEGRADHGVYGFAVKRLRAARFFAECAT